MSDGTITFNTELDNKDLEKQYQDAVKKVKKLEEDLQKQTDKQSILEKEFEEAGAAAESTRNKLKDLNAELERMRNVKVGKELVGSTPLEQIEAMENAANRIPQLEQEIKATTSEYDKQVVAVDRIAEKLGTQDAIQEQITAQLDAAKTHAGQIADKMKQADKEAHSLGKTVSGKVGKSVEDLGTRMQRVFSRVGNLIQRVLVFSVITAGLRQLRTWLSDVIAQDEEATKAIASLKSAFQVLAMPILQVVIPAFTKFVNMLAVAVGYIARGVNAIFGTTIDKSIEAAKKLNKEQKDTSKNIKNTGKAAKAASRYLAGFDELTLQSSGDTSTSSGSGANSLGDLSEANDKGVNWDAFDEKKIDEKLQKIMAIIGAALLAIGAILCFSGINIPLGITLMAIGALMLYGLYKENWGTMSEELRKAITTALVISGIVLVVLGAILCLSGVAIPLGVGMIAAGMALLIAEAALNWNSMSEDMRKSITEMLVVVGIVALVLGCILAFSGANVPIGIALIALGAATIVSAAALNWDTLGPMIRQHIDQVLSIVGIAALVIGILLCLTGVGVPVGVALILIGAASLVGAVALNWNYFKERLSEIWAGVKGFWDEHIRPVFTVQWWQDKASAIAEGLKNGIKAGINGAIGLLNRFIGWVNEKLHIKWEPLVIAGKEIVPAADFQLFKLPQVPQLAQGAVIPPNHTFLAALGDQTSGNNIETPEGLMRQIVREEVGGGELMTILQSILDAVENGHVLMVDKRILGQVANEQIKNFARMGGYA